MHSSNGVGGVQEHVRAEETVGGGACGGGGSARLRDG